MSETSKKKFLINKTSPLFLGLAAFAFMIAAFFQSRAGQSPAAFIALGAAFIALSTAAAARLKVAKVDNNDSETPK